MNLNELRYIVAVAQELNFRRAAGLCFVSQPALSLAVRKLEDELGVKLFERSKTEVKITSVGQRVVEQAQRTLEEAARVKEIARQGRDHLVGPLRLGAIHTIGPYLLPELIPVLKKIAPQMPLEVEENTTANLDQLLKNGRLDIIVIALPFGGPGVDTLPLYDEAFRVLVPTDHSWAKKTVVKPRELSKEHVLLLNTGHCFSNQVVEACPELTRRGGETQQGNSLETIRNMVASGLGISVLPCSATGDKYRTRLTKVVPFSEPAPSRRVALAWRRSFGRERAVAALAEAVRAVRMPCLQMLPDVSAKARKD
jgi:LysR family hydrogen peroxide-inducible transcriptional activator